MRRGWYVFLLLVAVSGLACAQQAAQQPRLGEEWAPLFNGKDLTGWTVVGGEKWAVADGAIYGEGISTGYSYLTTVKSYKDFFLRLSFKCESDGNSGVYLRTSFKPGTAEVSNGYQVEIDRVLNHHTGGLYGDNRAWWVWPASENETVLRPYDWNDMLIQVIGNRTVVRLNGVQMVDYTNPTPKSFDGAIALQLHSGGQGKMRFKDIYIRDLSVR